MKETLRALQAYESYLSCPPPRSLRRAAALHYQGDPDKEPTAHQFRQFKEWSRNNGWQARLERVVLEEIAYRTQAVATSAPYRPRPHWVYRLYDFAGQLLYVGLTLDPARRLSEHLKIQPWAGDVKRAKWFPVGVERTAALKAEMEHIARLRPIHNKVRYIA